LDKRSSLFLSTVSEEEKSFYKVDTKAQAILTPLANDALKN
jgi:hypothetical protein